MGEVIQFQRPLHVEIEPGRREMSVAEKIECAHYAIARLTRLMKKRPFVTGVKNLVLDRPACERNCPTCYMECAIAPERLAWWQKELVELQAQEADHG